MKPGPGVAAAFNSVGSNITWERLTCEEMMPHMPSFSASAIVWHNKDRRAYAMCAGCADHNVNNRGGILLATKPEAWGKEPLT